MLVPPGVSADDFPTALLAFPLKPGLPSLGVPFETGAAPDGHLPVGSGDYVEQELRNLADTHDDLLDNILTVAKLDHPHEALRLLQVVAVRRFQHLLRALPPAATASFAADRDNAVLETFRCIIGVEAAVIPPHVLECLHLPARLGGAALPSLRQEVAAAHYTSWAATLSPMLDALRSWDTPASTGVAMEMACIDTSQLPFAQHARAALAAIMPLSELSESVLAFAGQLTQPHTPVARAGVQTPQQPHTPQPPLKLPTLREIAAAPYTNLAPHIGHAAAARSVHSAFLQITVEAERARFLSRCGHGGAAFMVADRQPQLYPIPCDVYRLAVARALGISHPAIQITSCDKCELVFTTPLEAMDHLARCPKSPACHAVHKATVNVFNTIIDEAGFAGDRRNEVLDLRPDNTRPADILIKNFGGTLTHFALDVTVAGVMSAARGGDSRRRSDFLNNPGAAVHRAELLKFRQDANSSRPLHTVHRFSPLAAEEFGRLGAHAQAFLHEMATACAANRCFLHHLADDSPAIKAFVQLKLKDWRQRLAIAINLMHAVMVLERTSRSTQICGDRNPPPSHILDRYWGVCSEQATSADFELMEQDDTLDQ